ncbi:UDP-3-O-(3-hydroxymyristoyl)glucosamine N-acyltransferase [Amphibiibacter pelophylacis]|uniref:UDP-3-O-(3-hydroxymyristoyl)glucosamine N-acyltransferase n=1 Tax=Amphibiibacter pelophylacis TaxID=1799477 RepID=A0ACC6NYU1_9BURK
MSAGASAAQARPWDGHASAGEIARALGLPIQGDASAAIHRIAGLSQAKSGQISFLSQARLAPQLDSTQASVLIVRPDQLVRAQANPAVHAVLVSPDPYLSYARLTQWWVQRHQPLREQQVAALPEASPPASCRIHPSAVVDARARLGENVTVDALAHIAAGAVVGPGARVGSHCVIEAGAVLGADSVMRPRATLARDCRTGQRALLQSGAVIGGDGFGFAPEQGRWVKIEQLGGVLLGDDVEIGANTCVDRGALDDTVIEDGVKLDNLVQIGHNVHIGAHAAMAGCVGVAGSARIGAGCTVGGAGMVLGHLELAPGVHISAASLVTKSITQPGVYTGVFPIAENAVWEKNAATLRQLSRLRDKVRKLERGGPD